MLAVSAQRARRRRWRIVGYRMKYGAEGADGGNHGGGNMVAMIGRGGEDVPKWRIMAHKGWVRWRWESQVIGHGRWQWMTGGSGNGLRAHAAYAGAWHVWWMSLPAFWQAGALAQLRPPRPHAKAHMTGADTVGAWMPFSAALLKNVSPKTLSLKAGLRAPSIKRNAS